MRFILVNQRTPLGDGACSACSHPLGSGYVRDVASRKEYCDHNCYRRSEEGIVPLVQWSRLFWTGTDDVVPLGLVALTAAASCCLRVGAISMSWINATTYEAVHRADDPLSPA